MRGGMVDDVHESGNDGEEGLAVSLAKFVPMSN